MTTPKHSSLATIALILGGVAIGITEFVTMGLLPQIAGGVGVDIPTAGHAISAYAVGVVIGAPVLAAWGASKPRKGLLLGLVVAIIRFRARPGHNKIGLLRYRAGHLAAGP